MEIYPPLLYANKCEMDPHEIYTFSYFLQIKAMFCKITLFSSCNPAKINLFKLAEWL